MKRFSLYVLLALALILITSSALAGVESLSLSWYTVDGGGGTSSGMGYSMEGTIGQADAGYQMRGGEYTLVGGFWGVGDIAPPPSPLDRQLYLPAIFR